MMWLEGVSAASEHVPESSLRVIVVVVPTLAALAPQLVNPPIRKTVGDAGTTNAGLKTRVILSPAARLPVELGVKLMLQFDVAPVMRLPGVNTTPLTAVAAAMTTSDGFAARSFEVATEKVVPVSVPAAAFVMLATVR